MSIENLFSDLMEEKQDELLNILETKTPVKQSSMVRRKRRIGKIKAHRGTNWKTLKPKKGMTRVKIGTHYVRVRQTVKQRQKMKQVGAKLGRKRIR